MDYVCPLEMTRMVDNNEFHGEGSISTIVEYMTHGHVYHFDTQVKFIETQVIPMNLLPSNSCS